MGPQAVEIIVRGRLGADLIAALDGFSVATGADGMTSIVGLVPDQTRLLGLLDMFDDLHLEVVSVNPAASDDSHPSRVTTGG
jgi:hypothetical protein